MRHRILSFGILTAVLLSVMPMVATPTHAAPVAVVSAQSTQTQVTVTHAAVFDKSRFLLHMGFAYYAFHHFVYARYRQGAFARGASHRVLNFAKAALALAFAYHEVKVSINIANSSHSGFLHALVRPLNALGDKMSSVKNDLQGGNFNDMSMKGLAGTADSFSHQAGGIAERSTMIPGLS